MINPLRYVMDYLKKDAPRPDGLGGEVLASDTTLYVSYRVSPYNPDQLAARKGGLIVYEKMRRDDAIRACLFLRKYAVLCSGWMIEPASDDKTDIEIADFVNYNLNMLRGTFDDNLLGIMTAFEFGFSITEKVFNLINRQGSDYNGKVCISALKTRKPHGINFEVDEFGNLKEDGIAHGRDRFSPDKFIIYVNNREFDNWYGESDLRSCYRSWWSKDNIIKFWNIWLERYGMPPAVGRITKPISPDDREMLKNIVRNLQSKTSILLPEGVELEFPEISAKGAVSYKEAIISHDMAIARTLLTPSLLGISQQGDVGSYSQSKTQFDVFLFITEKYRRDIEELLYEHLIKELVSYNYNVSDYPKFKFKSIDDLKIQELAKIFSDAVIKGVISPSLEDENKFRRDIGWPERDIEGPLKVASYAYKGIQLSVFSKKCNFEKIEESLNSIEENSKIAVTSVIKKQRDWLIDFVMSKANNKQLNLKLINKLELKYGGELQSTIAEGLHTTYNLGRNDVRAEVNNVRGGKKFVVDNPFAPTKAIQWFNARALQSKNIINGGLSNKVKNVLMNYLETGEPIAETKMKILQLYQPYIGDPTVLVPGAEAPYKVEQLIRTNSTSAYNRGRVGMMDEVKEEVPMAEFSAILDDRTSDICEEANGKIFDRDDPDFERFIPPLHPNCRSLLIPITKSEMLREAPSPITLAEKDIILEMMPEEFGGRVGGAIEEITATELKNICTEAANTVVNIGGFDREVAIVINDAGNTVIGGEGGYKVGAEHYVSFSHDDAIKMRGAYRFIHNHPNGINGFSLSDLQLSNSLRIKSVESVALQRHTHPSVRSVMTYNEKYVDTLTISNEMGEIGRAVTKVTDHMIEEEVSKKGLDFSDVLRTKYSRIHSRMVCENMAKRFGWTYKETEFILKATKGKL